MKKILLFAIILGGAVAFTSCSKNECECTVLGTTITYDEDEAKDAGFEGDFKESCEDAGCKFK